MAQRILNNGDRKSEIRENINYNFSELYGIRGQYDKVIRTQADFVALYSSADWLGAKSVAFIGDGGTLEFTRATTGLKVPLTVRRIDGFNNAIIRINNYVPYSTSGILWYETTGLSSAEYSIRNITLNSNSASSTSPVQGFWRCGSVIDCILSLSPVEDSSVITTAGILSCERVIGCKSTVKTNSTANVTAYYLCNEVSGCTADMVNLGTGSAMGFRGCKQISSSLSKASGQGAARGFSECSQLVNCTGSGIGSLTGGHAFYNCSYLNGCKEGAELSTTGIWGGTWLFRDDQSCQLVRAV